MKMHYLRILICAIGFLIISSCEKEAKLTGGKTIQINVIADTMLQVSVHAMVVLDSAEAAIIGGATRVSHIDNKILLFDARFTNTLVLFDNKGKFLNKLSTGKGPNEILVPADYSIWKNEIYILDIGQKKMIVTDLELHPVKEFHANIFGRYFEILDENNWLFYSQASGFSGTIPYSFFVYPKSLDEPKERLLKIDQEQLQRVRIGNTISRETVPKVLCRPFDHNIYSYDGQSGLNVKYFLDFGSMNVTQDDLELGLDRVSQGMREGSKVAIDGEIIDTKEYFACSFGFKGKLEYFIFSKTENKTYCSFNSKVLPRGTLLGAHEGKLILMVQPEDYRKFVSKEGMDPVFYQGETKNAHNYILIYFTLT